MLYLWAAQENYWPATPTAPDDPFVDASSAHLFTVNHAALTAAGVRVPHLILADEERRHLDADLALLEDAGGLRLETLMHDDPAAAEAPLAALGDALHRMHTTTGTHHGRLTDATTPTRSTENLVLHRAIGHLDAAATRDSRIATHHTRIATRLHDRHAAVPPRTTYALVHGELGPDHVLVTPDGEPVVIDFEGLLYFDIEWDHAWLRMRFQDAYPALRPVPLDPARLAFYDYAQMLSLIEGPLRIADTDFPNRQWMLDLAEWHITRTLNSLGDDTC